MLNGKMLVAKQTRFCVKLHFI